MLLFFTILCGNLVYYQQSLKQAKHNLDEAQQLAALGSWERDLVSGKGYWSENHYHLFGLQPGTTAPSLDDFFAMIHADDREQVRETVTAAIRTGASYETTYRLAHDRDKRIFVSRGKVVCDASRKPVSVVGTVQDVTEKYERERLREELLQQKDVLITRLGHDLKTPLTPLVALLPLIRTRIADGKLCDLIDICIRNTNNIREQVDQTIRFSRLSSTGGPGLLVTDVVLASAADDAVAGLKDIAGARSTVIENRIAPGMLVRANMQELEEVLSNLISNGVKFSVPGSFVRIDAHHADGQVTVIVSDNGIGLSADEQSHIFDELYKADPSRHELGSSGLGLAICRKIVERHGGRIWAESPGKGQGTSISFTLSEGVST
ncbi:MAG: PAS domain-containing sensor histidine kinase [Geobacteraceae bacterium]|nr:PAS domain-containing sensor histidine kinase [Geobacteraceae bacterium]